MEAETGQKTRMSQKAVFRVGVVLVCALVVFGIIRQLSVPKSFGQYGYYRGDNVQEWVSMDQTFASGNQVCAQCHAQEVQEAAQAEHSQLDCQSCHGPMQDHVKQPNQVHPRVAGNVDLCGACHRVMVGRSKDNIRTVQVGSHSGGLDCIRCHDPHQPYAKIGGGR